MTPISSTLCVSTQAFWEESIHVLSDFHFLDNLLSYDKDSISPEVAAQVSTLRAKRLQL